MANINHNREQKKILTTIENSGYTWLFVSKKTHIGQSHLSRIVNRKVAFLEKTEQLLQKFIDDFIPDNQ